MSPKLGRVTPDDDSDWDETPGVIANTRGGRLGYAKYSDHDDECNCLSCRRNVMPLPEAPDPYADVQHRSRR